MRRFGPIDLDQFAGWRVGPAVSAIVDMRP